MKRSLLALGLLGSVLAGSALAAQLPAADSQSRHLSSRHGGDDDAGSLNVAQPSAHSSAGTHAGAHEHAHGGDSPASAAGSFDPAKLYGPDGEVMEPIPGINAPPVHHHHQSVWPAVPASAVVSLWHLADASTFAVGSGATEPSRVLNETAILASHDPNPLSYWVSDPLRVVIVSPLCWPGRLSRPSDPDY
jgi:hypothetical protein